MEEHEPNGDTKNGTKHSSDSADISDEGVSRITIPAYSLFATNFNALVPMKLIFFLYYKCLESGRTCLGYHGSNPLFL